MPAGGLAVERCLKECVSKRGGRVVCPYTTPRGSQSQRCRGRSLQGIFGRGLKHRGAEDAERDGWRSGVRDAFPGEEVKPQMNMDGHR